MKIAVNLLVLLFFLTAASCHRDTYRDKFAQAVSKESNRNCPRRLDQCTVMDSIFYDADSNQIVYNYTFQGQLDNDSILTTDVVEDYRQQLLQSLVNSINMRPYKEHEVIFTHRHYSQKSGKILLEISFTSKDY